MTSPYGTDPQEPGSELSGFGGADGSPRVSYLLRVNGVDRPVNGAWIGESLLYVLRERLGLAGAKGGCDQGECGACSVQLDGQLTAACLVPAALAADSEIRTVEGLAADGSASDVQRALAESGAVQCGYCIPGMAMAVHDLLERNHQPTELQAREALCGNLCRCTGYQGALAAIEKVAQSRAEAAEAAEAAAEAASEAADAAGPGEQAETADAADPDSLADDSLADDLAGEPLGRDEYPGDGYPVDEYPVYSDVEIPGQQQGEAQHIDHHHPDHHHPEPQADPLFGPMDGLNTEQPPAEQQYAYPVYAQQPQPEPYQAGFQPQAYPQAEYPLPGTQPPGAPEGAEPGVYVLPHQGTHQGTHQNTHAPEAGA
ncbi:(2Fe-2S)-binding protein [Streptacidiphilus jeojiensis]|uniref:(2Fe-2S)-binding protein n=1 Tax=Streptacidiphilus jeojiensis TaxID=3229225 RepID=UPI0036D31C7A